MNTKAMKRQCVLALTLALPCLAAAAATPVVYPAKGQSAQQQQTDQGECHTWAVQNTGVDPAQVATQPAATSSQPGGERLRGAARGALGGAAIGAIAGDTGKGAGVGAVVGTMAGGHRARQNQAGAQQQAQSNKNAQINTYYRAYSACLEGRGYTVK
ncbi:MAG: YMGG-like glycine zipper-containing protein [Rhodocyclaceae bacterium]|nr:YMGG-like glycine zipper-containing protein [Rhodocyclaceae bacterium]